MNEHAISNIIIIIIAVCGYIYICYLAIKNDYQDDEIERLRAENKRLELHVSMLCGQLRAERIAQREQDETFIVWREMWSDHEKARRN